MFEFTSLFLSNLIGNSSFTILPSATSLEGSITVISATNSTTAVITDENDQLFGSTVSSIASSVGTALISNGSNAYETTKKQLKVTETYIESLNEDELTYLITKLEEKEKILLTKEDNKINIKIDNNKTKTLK